MSGPRRRRLAVGVAAEVKSKLSVVEVVGETVSLKKAGTTYKGLCPFHGEKTPSFHVQPDKGFYYCFGCGAKGDALSFEIAEKRPALHEGEKVGHIGRAEAIGCQAAVLIDRRLSP